MIFLYYKIVARQTFDIVILYRYNFIALLVNHAVGIRSHGIKDCNDGEAILKSFWVKVFGLNDHVALLVDKPEVITVTDSS